MRTLFALGLFLSLSIAAYSVGRALPDEGVLLIAGVTCGVVLTIPIALLLLFSVTRPQVVTRTEYVDRVQGEIIEPVRQIEA